MQVFFKMIIKIKNLEVNCNIGIYDWEKTFDRKLIINVEMHSLNEKSCRSDDVKDTLDYQIIYDNIKKIIATKKYNLIETLAHDILEMICLQDMISFARVEIDKIKIFEDVYSCAVIVEKKIN
jgi:dihydroneopterin aldolase